ncbi:MAG: Scr1 family TA system antitoxin-like transcriptional regulator [Pseudonocardiaceae bacterium]
MPCNHVREIPRRTLGLILSHAWAASLLVDRRQTEEYSISATAGSARIRPDQVERLVSLRMERQRRLFSDADPLRLTAVIEESVLDRPTGTVH